MSHTSKISTEINDLTALGDAVRKLGGKFDMASREYQHYYGKTECSSGEITFSDAAYSIGVNRTQSGKYELLADFWSAGGLTEKRVNSLKQRYAVEKSSKELRKRGFRVHEKKMESGEIMVIAEEV